jgi:Ca2+/H+ antiporter
MPVNAVLAASGQFEVSLGRGPVIALLITLLVIGMAASAGGVRRRKARRVRKTEQ